MTNEYDKMRKWKEETLNSQESDTVKKLRAENAQLTEERDRYRKFGDEFIWGENNPETYESEMTQLRAEIDMYDRTCAEVRNELTAAGIPELTEDRLYVVPLAKRVRSLVAFRDAWKKMAEELENYADHKYLCNTGKPHGICNCGMLQTIKQLISLKESGRDDN